MSITVESMTGELVAMIEASINPGYRQDYAIARWVDASTQLERICALAERATSDRVKELVAKRITFRLYEALAAEKAAGRLIGQ